MKGEEMSKRERMKDPISVRKQESIANEMASLHERIMNGILSIHAPAA